MEGKNTIELSATLRSVLSPGAQEVYREAYQEAWNVYEASGPSQLTRESVAHQAGWTAMERACVQEPKTGRWYRKDESPQETTEARRGFWAKLKSLFS